MEKCDNPIEKGKPLDQQMSTDKWLAELSRRVGSGPTRGKRLAKSTPVVVESYLPPKPPRKKPTRSSCASCLVRLRKDELVDWQGYGVCPSCREKLVAIDRKKVEREIAYRNYIYNKSKMD